MSFDLGAPLLDEPLDVAGATMLEGGVDRDGPWGAPEHVRLVAFVPAYDQTA